MIPIKNKMAIQKMAEAGKRLSAIFDMMPSVLKPGQATLALDRWIEEMLVAQGLTSRMKGYHGYRHVSCISLNDVVVHGVPRHDIFIKEGDLVKVDVCASWKSYCADMARPFLIGEQKPAITKFVAVAQAALDRGIAVAMVGARLTTLSSAIQQEVERHGYGVVRDFAGHGIGKKMHEDPEILNYGEPGKGPVLQHGMAFALEPMITQGKYDVFVEADHWTVKTTDGSLACHVEDTVVITYDGPLVITREVK